MAARAELAWQGGTSADRQTRKLLVEDTRSAVAELQQQGAGKLREVRAAEGGR
jgi:hypothetical protein